MLFVEVGWDVSVIAIVPHRLAILPSYQRRGIARSFMSKAENIAKCRGYDYVRVDTCSLNGNVQKLLESCHYNFVGVLRNGFPLARDMQFNCYEKVVNK